MSYIRQYMENARNFANENYLNADGFIDDDQMYFTASEDFFNAVADRLARAKRREFAAAFAQETGVAGGFPSVLAEEIF